MRPSAHRHVPCEICILSGGRSSRMGRDKARLRLGRRTLLGHVRQTARQTGLPVRNIRKDLEPGKGPLGGIYTALKTSRARFVVFLSCDMPFVSAQLLGRLRAALKPNIAAAFFSDQFDKKRAKVGFPFILRAETLSQIEQLLASNQLSLQRLADALSGRVIRLKCADSRWLFNINTPGDWDRARRIWSELKRA